MIKTHDLLNSLSLEVPALDADAEGKLRGGFSAYSAMGAESGHNENCGENCTCNENCPSNPECSNTDCGTNCGCNTNCVTCPPPPTNPPTGPTTGDPASSALFGFGNSFLF